MEKEELRKELLKRGVNLTDKYICFWDSVFSNFHPCEFTMTYQGGVITEKKKFSFISSEQAFMWQKAMFFEDYEVADKIIEAKTPWEAKKLGRTVRNFDDDKWKIVRDSAMYNAVYHKFSQNQDLKDIITAEEFDGKEFVEGSPYDKIWGVGIMWDDPKIEDEKNWDGLNLLGKTLDKVRVELKTKNTI